MTEIAAGVWAFDRLMRFAARFYLSFSLPPRALTATGGKQTTSLVECAQGQIQAFGATADYTRLRISVPANRLRIAGQVQGFMQGIAAGDDIRITIPRLQWVGEHPFTVFAVGLKQDDAKRGYIDLLIRTEAGLTRKLARRIVKLGQSQEDEKDIELAGTLNRHSSVSVLIEGPFWHGT